MTRASSPSFADSAQVVRMIQAYQRSGHMAAHLDPLGLRDASAVRPQELELASYFKDWELQLPVRPVSGQSGFALAKGFTVAQLARRLQETYASTVGVEFLHVRSKEERDWFREKLETPTTPQLTVWETDRALEKLCRSTLFESFLGDHFKATKRFGIAGCESLVVGLDALLSHASHCGVDCVIMGMAHRGRLNVLANVLGRPLEAIMCEFRGASTEAEIARLREHSDRMFWEFDVKRNNLLDVEELSLALARLGIHVPMGETSQLLEAFDVSLENSLNPDEFFELARSLLVHRTAGDEKFHLGATVTLEVPSQGAPLGSTDATSRPLTVSLLPNPSHLAAVNPVVIGATRARQRAMGDTERTRCMPLLLHGDAMFDGQGVVAEMLGLSDLHDYTTGGCVHVVVNNQMMDPHRARSARYCTDIAKSIRAPIFHVNGGDVAAVVRVCKLATEYRQRFQNDVVVDLVCYRSHGQQGIDNPLFTLPAMYRAIQKKASVLNTFVSTLLDDGHLQDLGPYQALRARIQAELERKLEASRSYAPEVADWRVSSAPSSAPTAWESLESGVSEDALKRIGRALTTLPRTLRPHPAVRQLYSQRAAMIEAGDSIDWALAEMLAWGSMLAEGRHVRVSGQDSQRGAFSHRHAVLYDQVDLGRQYTPLANLREGRAAEADFTIFNSSVGEYAVLGFEFGYSIEHPSELVVWEAQFGDFANTAQCVFDQYIASAEEKWQVQSGIVVMLPHGLEGGGPEHSSARIERYLQLCDDDERVMPLAGPIYAQLQLRDANLRIVNVTTPANYFHVLRQQMARPFRKPLLVMSPKGLLHHKSVVSPLSRFTPGSTFQAVLAQGEEEEGAAGRSVRRVIFCSGSVSLDLHEARQAARVSDRDADGVAIYKLEQLSPFPYDEVRAALQRHAGSAEEIVWCQEESMNSGAWTYVRPRLEMSMQASDWFSAMHVRYVGRPPSASPGKARSKFFAQEQKSLLIEALSLS